MQHRPRRPAPTAPAPHDDQIQRTCASSMLTLSPRQSASSRIEGFRKDAAPVADAATGTSSGTLTWKWSRIDCRALVRVQVDELVRITVAAQGTHAGVACWRS